MPFDKRKVGDQWEVYNTDTGESKGMSQSEEKANAHLAALYVHMPKDEKLQVPTTLIKSDEIEHFTQFVPIMKIDRKRHQVWGWASDQTPDHAGEAMDYVSSKPYMMKWSAAAFKRSNGLSLGNLRSMHRNVAAGKLIELKADDASSGFWNGAEVVDPVEWDKVEKGVYTGFSIGGDYVKRWYDPSLGIHKYTANPKEISLVDAPCNPNATFQFIKEDGSMELRKFAPTNGENLMKVEFDDFKAEVPAGATKTPYENVEKFPEHQEKVELDKKPELSAHPTVPNAFKGVREVDEKVGKITKFQTLLADAALALSKNNKIPVVDHRQMIKVVDNRQMIPVVNRSLAKKNEFDLKTALDGKGESFSLNDYQTKINEAWRKAYPSNQIPESNGGWIADIYPGEEKIIICENGKYFKTSYSYSDTGDITFGTERVEVEQEKPEWKEIVKAQQNAVLKKFEESKHPRADDGEWTSGGSGGGENKDKESEKLKALPESKEFPKPESAKTKPNVELNNMLFSDGYIGSMGKTWETPTQDDLERAIVGAMEIEGKTRDEIVAILESGKPVRWCKSPNFYYDHSYGKIGTKQTPKPVETVECSCGHTIPKNMVMSSSMGTSCPDCYDRMSKIIQDETLQKAFDETKHPRDESGEWTSGSGGGGGKGKDKVVGKPQPKTSAKDNYNVPSGLRPKEGHGNWKEYAEENYGLTEDKINSYKKTKSPIAQLENDILSINPDEKNAHEIAIESMAGKNVKETSPTNEQKFYEKNPNEWRRQQDARLSAKPQSEGTMPKDNYAKVHRPVGQGWESHAQTDKMSIHTKQSADGNRSSTVFSEESPNGKMMHTLVNVEYKNGHVFRSTNQDFPADKETAYAAAEDYLAGNKSDVDRNKTISGIQLGENGETQKYDERTSYATPKTYKSFDSAMNDLHKFYETLSLEEKASLNGELVKRYVELTLVQEDRSDTARVAKNAMADENLKEGGEVIGKPKLIKVTVRHESDSIKIPVRQ